jgi:hypothetical protein
MSVAQGREDAVRPDLTGRDGCARSQYMTERQGVYDSLKARLESTSKNLQEQEVMMMS